MYIKNRVYIYIYIFVCQLAKFVANKSKATEDTLHHACEATTKSLPRASKAAGNTCETRCRNAAEMQNSFHFKRVQLLHAHPMPLRYAKTVQQLWPHPVSKQPSFSSISGRLHIETYALVYPICRNPLPQSQDLEDQQAQLPLQMQ